MDVWVRMLIEVCMGTVHVRVVRCVEDFECRMFIEIYAWGLVR